METLDDIWKVPYTPKDYEDSWKAYCDNIQTAVRGATSEVRDLWRKLTGRYEPAEPRVFAWYRGNKPGHFHPFASPVGSNCPIAVNHTTMGRTLTF